MFAPRWKKEAKLLYKGAKKFLNYKRDLLEPEKVEAIEGARAQLLKAVKDRDRDAVHEAEKAVTKACERALPRYRRQNALEENIEVFFVAIVVALGIRAYFLQPFRIPTGSMQPTLNGIIGQQVDKKDFPSFPMKAFDWVTKGRSYIHKEVTRDRTFRFYDPSDSRDPNQMEKNIVQVQKWNFFTYTYLRFSDGDFAIHAPKDVVINEFGLRSKIRRRSDGRAYVPGGTVLSGWADSGDLVLVDKVSYNFRRPKRGEVFVFDTRGIEGIAKRSTSPQGAGSHYIKRLAGVPGDKLQIKLTGANPNGGGELFVDGKPATAKGLRQVGRGEGPYKGEPGYEHANPNEMHRDQPRSMENQSDTVTLASRKDLEEAGKKGVDRTLYRGYYALGDNTDNSLDSRYWGSVKEYNVVGPALLSLWPFRSGHWGLIK